MAYIGPRPPDKVLQTTDIADDAVTGAKLNNDRDIRSRLLYIL